MLNAVVVAVGSLCLLICLLPRRAIGTSARPDLPGPKGLPLLGNALDISGNLSRALDYFRDNARTYGRCSTITIPFVRMIDVSAPELLQHIQGTAFLSYEKGSYFQRIFRDLLGRGLFVVDGQDWMHQRKATVRLFSKNAYNGPITHSIDQGLSELREKLDEADGASIDVSSLIYSFTTNVFCRIAFGQSIATKGGVSKEEFGTLIDEGQALLDSRLHNPFWPITEVLTGERRRIRRLLARGDQYAYAFINDPHAKESQTLLSTYLTLSDHDGTPLEASFIRDAILNIIVAGRDPCACALNWVLYHVIALPDLVETLRNEVSDILGEDGAVTYSNFGQLKQCTATVWEALRLHPSIPKNILCAVQDDVLPNGVVIQKGDYVRFSDWQMARDPSLWGEDCLEFKPSRWLDEEGSLKRTSAYLFHSFNAGPRACVGQTLATFESIAVLVELLRHYDLAFDPTYLANLQRDDDGLYPMYKASLTHPLKQKLVITARKR